MNNLSGNKTFLSFGKVQKRVYELGNEIKVVRGEM